MRGETTRVPEIQVKSLGLVIGLRAEGDIYLSGNRYMRHETGGIGDEAADLWEDVNLRH